MKGCVVIAGGTGFIGRTLAPFFLAHGYEVIVLTRGPSREGVIRHVNWDGTSVGRWVAALEGARALVNLSGRSINCRHTPRRRRDIIASRVDSIRALSSGISKCTHPPEVFVQTGGIGIYGDSGAQLCDEAAAHGSDFVAQVCERWEAAFAEVNSPAMRKVLLRLGVVLGPGGGFLETLGRVTRLFLGGHVGDGRQFISWIHIKDLCRVILWAIERDEISGTFNAIAPHPVTNAELMRELRRALHRPWSPPVPVLAARVGAWLMGSDGSLALASQRCVPRRLLAAGFAFDFPTLHSALVNIYPPS